MSEAVGDAELAASLRRAAAGQTFGTILADPPWQFVNRTGKVAPEHRRLLRYGTLTTERICALPVAEVAAGIAHLYLWVPNALLPDGLEVMRAWGFTYKANIVWHKVRKDGGSDGRAQQLQTVYSSTKRGLDLFTKAMVKELKDTPVLVQSVRPGILITDGFVREIGVMGPERFTKWRKALNILGDQPEDVAPWLVDKILAMDKSGQHVQWLTNAKIARRFAMAGFNKRDLFARYGL